MQKTKKVRILAIVMALIMAIGLLPMAALAAPIPLALSLDSMTVSPGDIIEVALNVDSNPGITNIEVRIVWDANVLVPVTTDAPVSPPRLDFTPGTVLEFPPLLLDSRLQNPVNIMAGIIGNPVNSYETGPLATLRFRILDDAPLGVHESALIPRVENADDRDWNIIPGTFTAGAITIVAAEDPTQPGSIRERLVQAITDAENLRAADYVARGWEALLRNDLPAARSVRNNANATDEAMQAAIDALEAAVAGLVYREVSGVADGEEIYAAMRAGLDALVANVPRPHFGSVGGEWTVFALARAFHPVPDGYFENYLLHIARRLDHLYATTDPNSTVMFSGGGYYWDYGPVYTFDFYGNPIRISDGGIMHFNVNGNKFYNQLSGRWEVRLGNAAQATENARLIVALTSLGVDASAFVSPHTGNTYDLIARLGNRHNATSMNMLGENQGLNGPMWAQIAIDSRDWNNPYEVFDRSWVPGTTGANPVTSEERINWLLRVQLNNGGWTLTHFNHQNPNTANHPADPDMTGMALLALAPYYNYRADVRAAYARALEELSRIQLNNGGYHAWGADNVQSAAWVSIPLTAIGIDPQTDSRFVMPGGNPISAVLRFQNPETGAFTHPHWDSGGSDNGMATDQGTYAVVDYWRFINGMNSLFNMADAFYHFDFSDLLTPPVQSVVNRDTLAMLIAEAQALDPAAYVQNLNWARMTTTLNAAVNVYNDENATQARIDEIASELAIRLSELTEAPQAPAIDRTALAELIEYAQELDPAAHVQNLSWIRMINALGTAVELYNNANATQVQIDAAANTLNTRINAIAPLPIAS